MLDIKEAGTAGIFPLKVGYWSDAIVIIVSGNFPLIAKAAGLVQGRRQHCRYRMEALTPLSFAGRKRGGTAKLGGVMLACSLLIFSCPNPALINIKFLLYFICDVCD